MDASFSAELSCSDKRKRKPLILTLCFAVPFVMMVLLYCLMEVWPAGENSVLVLDLNAQYIYFFEQFRSIITSGDSIIYSFRRALGGEFMGIFAYYLSSPFSLITALFPKGMITEAMYLLLVLKCGLSGLTFGFLCEKNRKLKSGFVVALSVMYALSSFAVVMQHNVMWTDNIIIFPVILYAVDELIKHGHFKLYVICVVYAVMSNFYIGYMTCLFVFIWFFARYFMMSPEERNPDAEKAHFAKTFGRIALFSCTAGLISAIIILPIYYSLTFGKFSFSTPDFSAKQLYDFADLLTKTFFGSYDSVRPTGMPFLYCGTLAFLLAPLYFTLKEIPFRRKIGYALVTGFLFVSFNLSTLDIIWHGMQKPNWLNARFAFMFCCLELIMAAEVLSRIEKTDGRTLFGAGALWSVILVILSKIGAGNLKTFESVWAGLLFIILVTGLTLYYRTCVDTGHEKLSAVMSVILSAAICIEALGNGHVMMESLDEDVSYSNRNSYVQMMDTYLPAVREASENDDTFYRSEKLVHRKKNDNFALGINGLTNSTSTLNARAVALLKQFGYAAQSHWSYYSGATAVSDAIFGIKYVMADETDDKPVMEYIHDLYDLYASTDTHIDVYENPYSLSIAYAVDESVIDFDPVLEDDDEKYTDPFTYMNGLLSSMTGRDITVWRRVDLESSKESGCDLIFAPGHRGYLADGILTPKVTYTLNIESTDSVYVYFPSEYPRTAELKVDGEKLGKYFDKDSFSIRELGSFDEGSEVEVSLVMEDEDMYIRAGCSYFWYFDENAFVDAVSYLRDGTMTAYSDKDDYLYGTITVPSQNEIVFTTIPYDEGWKITVDGENAELIPVLNDSLIAFRAGQGEHEIEMKYRPWCITYGLILTSCGILLFACFCAFDVLKRKYLIKQRNGRAEQ